MLGARSWETLAVPGLMVLSTFPPTTRNGYASGGVTDHRTPLSQRWASWYVTGRPGPNRHMGNKLMPSQADTSPPVLIDSLEGRIDLKGYSTPYSDVVALMVFEHQTHMTNLLTYIGWEGRVAEFERRGKAARRTCDAAGQDRRDRATSWISAVRRRGAARRQD